jgi:hypothetical protein
MKIPELLFTDDLPVGSFALNGYQKGIDKVVKYCRDSNLICSLKKTKILIFKEGENFMKNEKWFMHDQITEVIDEIISYLGVTLKSTGGL